MKLITFRKRTMTEHAQLLGLIFLSENKQYILDLTSYYSEEKIMSNMMAYLHSGDQANGLAQDIYDSLTRSQSSTLLQDLKKSGLVLALDEVKLNAPIPNPGKMIGVGMNYMDHISEEGKETFSVPEFPVAFIKATTSLIGENHPIVIPKHSSQIDYEVELAVVIGKRCKNVKVEEAYEYVAGYSILNDVSARDIQFAEMKKGLLMMGKNFDTFGPFGPWIVTKDEISDPQDLVLQLWVNGEIRQNSNTKHMIFSIPELIAYWSRITLEPGDVISTGTPSGVAAFRKPDSDKYYLKPGDLVEASVEHIGILKNPVSAS